MQGRTLVAAAIIVLGAGVSSGFNELVFDQDALEWRATHVVVGRLLVESKEVEVLESWRGDLRRGERVAIPTFSPFVRARERPLVTDAKLSRATVSGERGVFYLVKKENGTFIAAAEAAVSVVWIEEGHAFAYGAGGLGQIAEVGLDEIQLHARLAETDAKRTRIERASGIADLGSRAWAIVGLATDESRHVRAAALLALRLCDAEGPRAIEDLLAKKSLVDQHATLLMGLSYLSTTEGLAAAKKIASEELAYWKRIAPTLEENFAQGVGLAGEAEAEYLLARRTRLVAAISILKCRPDEDSVLGDLGDLFKNEPVLAKGAPEVLAALRGGIPY